MKLLGLIIFATLSLAPVVGQSLHEVEIKKKFELDTTLLIRNPGMGWTIYDDASGPVANAKEFWQLQDTIARKYATTLYIRWRWTDMEPEEGKYAWEYDDNFKALVQGALDRGLRLAFRVYVASQDNQYESTPKFVFDAGAKYYMEKGVPGDVRSPYPDDPIFQQKFENFIQAFAKKFDDAQLVNYIDGYNLGWWGEGHSLKFKNPKKANDTFQWIINLYGNAFKQVPLVITVDSQIGHDLELKYAIHGQGYSVRRDGYGSTWMPESQKKLLKGLFPSCFVVAECCYWQDHTIEWVNAIDKMYDWNSWGDYYKQVVDEALETHANYLDLREPLEATRWTSEANADVQRFLRKGGYRLYPASMAVRQEKRTLQIDHTWQNFGVGVLPNHHPKKDGRYKLSFALLHSQTGDVAYAFVDRMANPGTWIKGQNYQYSTNFTVPASVKGGRYSLVVSIIDTTTGKPAVKLSVKGGELINDWLVLGQCTLK